VIVPVTLVTRVPVPVVHVVGVIAMLDGVVPAAFAVRVLMPGVHIVRAARALVSMVAVRAMHVRVVRVIDVVVVLEGHVTAARTVHVRMIGVRLMLGFGSHHTLPALARPPGYAALLLVAGQTGQPAALHIPRYRDARRSRPVSLLIAGDKPACPAPGNPRLTACRSGPFPFVV